MYFRHWAALLGREASIGVRGTGCQEWNALHNGSMMPQKSLVDISPLSFFSLPRYPHNGKIKGFAFIEFSTLEGAEKACQVKLFNPQKYEEFGWGDY